MTLTGRGLKAPVLDSVSSPIRKRVPQTVVCKKDRRTLNRRMKRDEIAADVIQDYLEFNRVAAERLQHLTPFGIMFGANALAVSW